MPVLLPIWILSVFSLFTIQSQSEFTRWISPQSFLAVVFVGVVTVIFANKKAIGALRRAGLWNESREIVRRTATTFAGETLSFQEPNSRWSKLGLALFLLAVAASIGGFALFFATQIFERIGVALGCAFFFGCAMILVASRNQPNVRLDERGVFSYYRNFWPRLVRWNEIESAQFCLWNNFNDGADVYTIKLANADGKTVLTMNAATFQDAPPGFEARFTAELKRRLTGEGAAPNARNV